MPDLLFIYGTLHPDRAPAAIAPTVRQLKPFNAGQNRATIQGRLHDLGPYPGVVLSEDPATVPGELFVLPDGSAGVTVLARLDDYEDFHPGHPQDSLFLRQRVIATLQEGASAGVKIECWVYTYNQPVPTSTM